MRALLNVRNAVVTNPIGDNMKGRFLITDDGADGTNVARLWANDGTIIAQLSAVPTPALSRGATTWMVNGLDVDGQPAEWTVKTGGCGCGQ